MNYKAIDLGAGLTKVIFVVITLILTTYAKEMFRVDKLNNKAIVYQQTKYDIITPPASTHLLESVPKIPKYLNSSELVMRVKSESGYNLYKGDVNSSNYSRLKAFKIPEQYRYKNLCSVKFYLDVNQSEQDDIEFVYFDKEYLYVENIPMLACKFDEWVEFEPLDHLPHRLFLFTSPSGATIIKGDTILGKSPLSFKLTKSEEGKPLVVKCSNRDFYSQYYKIETSRDGVTRKSLVLTTAMDYEKVNPLDYIDTTLTNVMPTELLKKMLLQKREREISNESEVIARFEDMYPVNIERMSHESSRIFDTRKSWYDVDKFKERTNLKSDRVGFKKALKEIDEHIAKLDRVVHTETVAVKRLTLGNYRADKSELSFNVTVQQRNFLFTYNGKIKMPISVMERYRKSPSKNIDVKYHSRMFVQNIEGRRESIYFLFDELRIPFEGMYYKAEGTFSLPNGADTDEYVRYYKDQKIVWDSERPTVPGNLTASQQSTNQSTAQTHQTRSSHSVNAGSARYQMKSSGNSAANANKSRNAGKINSASSSAEINMKMETQQ